MPARYCRRRFRSRLIAAFLSHSLRSNPRPRYNSFDKTLGLNLLVTYRVNAGTVFYLGYDDRYRQGRLISETLFPTTEYERTNRAFFTKLQYLFRY